MSNYRDWTSDFPSRCADLLKFYSAAKQNDREVTLLLAIAGAAMCLPRDHFEDKSHPHFRGKEAKTEFSRFGSTFVGPEFTDARYGRLCEEVVTPQSKPDQWHGFADLRSMGSTVQTSQVFSTIRNALCHGNIFTNGKRDIQDLVFLSRRIEAGPYDCVVLSPNQFRAFLEKWIDWAKKSNIKPSTVDAVCREWNIGEAA